MTDKIYVPFEEWKNAKLLAIDFGTRQLGLAVGNAVIGTSSALTTLTVRRGSLACWNEFNQILKEWAPTHFVLGYPLNLNGTPQAITRSTLGFQSQLQKRYALPIFLQDERLSSVEARSELFKKKGERALTKSNVDALSAQIILNDFLERFKPDI